MNIHIKNGRLIDPLNKIDAKQDVFVADQRIAAIGKAPQGFVAEQVIDASGMIVIPGLVDVAARLREPGYEYKATLESEMEAAMAGGVTSLSCPPDTDPPLDEPGLVEMLKHRARNLNQARVYPVGALTAGLKGQELTEMSELVEAGCVAFSQADAPLTDTRVLMRAMQYAATLPAAMKMSCCASILFFGSITRPPLIRIFIVCPPRACSLPPCAPRCRKSPATGSPNAGRRRRWSRSRCRGSSGRGASRSHQVWRAQASLR